MHQVCLLLMQTLGKSCHQICSNNFGPRVKFTFISNLSCLVALILVLIASPCTIYVFITWYILQCIRYVYANTGEIMSPDLQQQLWIKGQPNNLGEVDAEKGEDCVEFRTSWFPQHHWNDATCSDEIESICEMWFYYCTDAIFWTCQFFEQIPSEIVLNTYQA